MPCRPLCFDRSAAADNDPPPIPGPSSSGCREISGYPRQSEAGIGKLTTDPRHTMRIPGVVFVLWASLVFPPMLYAVEERVADPKELPRFPPVAAGDALNTFQLRKGFRLEQ